MSSYVLCGFAGIVSDYNTNYGNKRVEWEDIHFIRFIKNNRWEYGKFFLAFAFDSTTNQNDLYK